MRARASLSLRTPVLLCLTWLLSGDASAEEAAAGFPARYVVFEIDSDGAVRPQKHRIVRLTSPRRTLSSAEVTARLARPPRDEESVHVRMFAADGGLAYEDVVRVPRWTRAEFAV